MNRDLSAFFFQARTARAFGQYPNAGFQDIWSGNPETDKAWARDDRAIDAEVV